MAGRNSSSGNERPDVLASAVIYRVKRDALMIVSNMNRGGHPASPEKMKRQIVFVQGQLCAAVVADPSIPATTKDKIMAFQCQTILENIDDRRGARRRGKSR